MTKAETTKQLIKAKRLIRKTLAMLAEARCTYPVSLGPLEVIAPELLRFHNATEGRWPSTTPHARS